MKLNDILKLNIEKIGYDGDGVAVYGPVTVYVANTIPGDVVEARIIDMGKTYAHALLLNVIQSSPYRIKPKCQYVRECGGCQILEMEYKAQLSTKQQKVQDELTKAQIPQTYKFYDTIGCKTTFRYRNKAIYPISRNADGKIIAGFFARRSHDIVEGTACKIGPDENSLIVETIIKHMEEYAIEPYCEKTQQGVVRHVMIRKAFATGEIMVSIIINADSISHPNELVESIKKSTPGIKDISLNINKAFTNCIKGNQIISLYGDGYITDKIDNIKFKISPLSFYQVNSLQTKMLYSKALEFANLTRQETVFDLYCGVGTISLFLARNARKVYGVEIIDQAISDANENARINRISNTEFIVGKAEVAIPDLVEKQGIKADVVVVDPPRKGCDKTLLDTIIKMKPRRMVYVSCDCATLARDLKYLSDNGFIVRKIQPVDMFPHSIHVETVAALTIIRQTQVK